MTGGADKMEKKQPARSLEEYGDAFLDLYKRLVEFTGDAVYVYTYDEGELLFANQGFIDLLELDGAPKDVRGKKLDQLLVYLERPGTIREAANEHGEIHNFEYHFKTLKGHERYILHDSFIITDPETGKKRVEAIVRDITAHKEHEHHLKELNRQVKMIAQCNQAVARATDQRELLDQLCRILTVIGGYRAAWIGVPEYDSMKSIRVIAQAGCENDEAKVLSKNLQEAEEDVCPAARAIQSGKPTIVQNLLKTEQYAKWHAEAAKLGIISSVAIPVMVENQLFGVLCVCQSYENAFLEEEVQLLLELVSDLEFGIFSLKMRAEREAIEMALSESESRFRNAFETAGAGMALVAPDGRWLKVNKAFCDIVGYTARELQSMSFQDITHPDDLGKDVSRVEKVLNNELPYYHIEKRYMHKEGHEIWIFLSASLVKDRKGLPLYFVFQIQDVTERKKAEAALRDSEQKFKALVENIPAVVFRLTPSGKVQYVSPKVSELYGYSPDELIGKDFTVTTPEEEIPRIREAFQRLFNGEEIRGIQVKQKNKAGTVVTVEVNMIPMRTEGKVVAAQGIMRSRRADDQE
ncbi:MAG: PAS domain S-box protein [Candidatus Omnitrophica bacterium]|nr:PAS domain S-box protein [Candidatus Omnitrophota bacterium]